MENTVFIDFAREKKKEYRFARPGRYVMFGCNHSGALSAVIDCPGVELYIFGIYYGRKEDNFKLETVQHHRAPGSFSRLVVNGAFSDNAGFGYRGTIRIDKGADKTEASQTNRNVITGDKCFVDSRPYLEILADDVVCRHASATGRLPADQIGYAMSRGLGPGVAEKLLVAGHLDEIVHQMKAVDRNLPIPTLPYHE